LTPLTEAGADRVRSEELESIVQLFAGILRDYRISANEIEMHVEAMRRGGYAALREELVKEEFPVVVCENLDQNCLDSRTVTVRPGAPISGQPLAALRLEQEHRITIRAVYRDGTPITDSPLDFVLQPGDKLVLSGTAAAFAESAPLFRTDVSEEVKRSIPAPLAQNGGSGIDTEQVIELKVDTDTASCSHLDQVYPVTPSAKGCEECLRIGDEWVHLRICMTCGHVGCCDDSKKQTCNQALS
jgi:Putative regulatory, ligand-binding protein related to C-terminal domains of K+ channels